jgi:hypothetical protein
LANYFNKYFDVNCLGMISGTEASNEQEQQLQFDVLMNTLVEIAIDPPPVDNLCKELILNGFVEGVRCFLLEDAPCRLPSWLPALYSMLSNNLSESLSLELKEEWRFYFD